MSAEDVIFSGSGSKIPSVIVWENRGEGTTPFIVKTFPAGYSIYTLAVSPNGQRLAAGTRGGWIHVYSLTDFRAAQDSTPVFDVFHQPAATSLAFCTDEILASGGLDGHIKLWSITERRLLADLNAHARGVLALRQIGSLVLASIGEDRVVRVWDLDSLEAKFISDPFDLPKIHALTTLEYCPKTGQLMHGSRAGEMHIYDVRKGFTKRLVRVHQGDFCAIACGSDYIVTGGFEDFMLKVWSLSLDQIIHHTAATEGIISVAWGGTERVMSVFSTGTAQIWTVFGRLSPALTLSDNNLRVCQGLPENLVTSLRILSEKRWRDTKLTEARELMRSNGSVEQYQLSAIVDELNSRGFGLEANLILAEAANIQGRYLWQLEALLAIERTQEKDEEAVPTLYALADLLSRMKEPGLAKEYLQRLQSIQRDYRDTNEKLQSLEKHPLLNLLPKDGVRADLRQPGQMVQEIDKYSILQKKFFWKVVIDTKDPVYMNNAFELHTLSEAILDGLQSQLISVSRCERQQLSIFMGNEIRPLTWLYIPCEHLNLGLVFALEIRVLGKETEFISYAVFDPCLLVLAETFTPDQHNLHVKEIWLRQNNSSETKRWLRDVNQVCYEALLRLQGKVTAEEDEKF